MQLFHMLTISEFLTITQRRTYFYVLYNMVNSHWRQFFHLYLKCTKTLT